MAADFLAIFLDRNECHAKEKFTVNAYADSYCAADETTAASFGNADRFTGSINAAPVIYAAASSGNAGNAKSTVITDAKAANGSCTYAETKSEHADANGAVRSKNAEL